VDRETTHRLLLVAVTGVVGRIDLQDETLHALLPMALDELGHQEAIEVGDLASGDALGPVEAVVGSARGWSPASEVMRPPLKPATTVLAAR
jgi:hypothetical protein